MRIKLTVNELSILFLAIKGQGYTSAELAQELGVHERTLRDWKRGKFTVPAVAYRQLIATSGLSEELITPVFVSERSQRRLAGQKGGRKYQQLYGAPGTYESRVKGGEASFEYRKVSQQDIYSRKQIKIPARDN